jgi:hypothetical protein
LSDTEKEEGVQWDSASAIHRSQESHDLDKIEVLYDVLIGFGVLVKLLVVRLIKMCLN